MIWLAVAVLAGLCALPAVLGPYGLAIAINVLFFAYLGQAWNVVGGYAGQLSAGHAAFVGVGGYTAAVLALERGLSPWIGMLAGATLAALLGGVIGYLGFRFGLRGFYFVLLTVAFAEVCRIVASNWERVGGAVGLYLTFTGDPRQMSFQDDRAWYYLVLGLVTLATAVVWALERRRFGMYLTAIREDETACEALGVNTFRAKLLAMVLSSFLTGLAGTVYAFRYASLQPNAVFGIPLSVEIILGPIVGGSGTLLGPLVGACILTPLGELSRAWFGRSGWHGAHLVVYGVLLVAVVLFVPQGAVPWARQRLLREARMSLLEVRGLSKRFGGLQAVHDLSFGVDAGEIVALIGPNGAGKTTVFGLVSGFLAPDAGEITFRGRALRGLPPHAVNALGLARTFQIMRPFPRLSVLRNVTIGALGRHAEPRTAEARARAVLDEVGLGARADAPAGSLTLAERKRLELARALATEPALLLLDEVMSGLNDTETERIVDLVRAINARGIAVLLIEHVMRAVMSLAGRIVVLCYGERIAEGPPEAVAADRRVIEAYLGEEPEA